MGKVKCFKCCCPPCFRAKFTPSQVLPKPKEAEETDGVPFIDAKEDRDILIIRKIDPCTEINGLLHHTSKFELMTRKFDPQLVVRRGQTFKLILTLNRPYNQEKDGVSFIFTVDDEEQATYGQGTLIAIPLLKRVDRRLSWNAVIDTISENVITVLVTTAYDAVVAKWRLEIDTRIINGDAYSYCWDSSIYLLFNPWCKSDQVFMKAEEWLDESLLNDTGIIWRGTAKQMRPVIWKYDQFDKNILDCALYVVRIVGKVKGSFRSDAVRTARALAAAVNSVDDSGVVMGNWSEDNTGGTPPTRWLGSREILQEYYKKKKPVKYGQCWVFSGVLTTIARAIGIPSRVITNYSSAHDTQSSLTFDYFLDSDGKILEALNSDSIWNFHVWNEVWMQRLDLGREYGGWQAVDATPQERSEEEYRAGPTSVFAIKQGEVLRPYDGGFLYAEVNADKVFWRYSGPTQPLKLLRKDIYAVGQQISTKTPGRFDREDITSSYKYPEKSQEERTTMLKALRQSENLFARYYLNEDFNDIYFNFDLKDDIKIGSPFHVVLTMKNKSKINNYQVSAILRAETVTYQGKLGKNVKKEDFDVLVKADSTHEVTMFVTYQEYSKKLVDQSSFIISCLATVKDTKFEYYAQDDFRVRKPDIKIVLQENPVLNQEVKVEISLENSLPVPYKNGEFTVTGPGIDKSVKIKVKGSVNPGEKAIGKFKFVPIQIGKHTIAAKFRSKEIDDVDGFLEILVESKKDESRL